MSGDQPQLATQAIADATKLALTVVEPGMRLFESLFGQPARIAGDMMKDWLFARRVRNQMEYLAAVDYEFETRGVAARALSSEFGLSLMEAVACVEDETLRSMWVELTRSATEDCREERPSYVAVLRTLSGADATHFAELVAGADYQRLPNEWYVDATVVSADVRLALPTLIHARLLEPLSTAGFRDGYRRNERHQVDGSEDVEVNLRCPPLRLTLFGEEFAKAVGIPFSST